MLAGDGAISDVTRRGPTDAETAALGSENQRSDAAAVAAPSILVLNDLWRYVPGYFQTLPEPVQPRSEAGRRLLERRRRQIERQSQHQQQQQQQRRQQRQSAVKAAAELGENQRGSLPVDELLAYITNSTKCTSSGTEATSTPTAGPGMSRKGRRKKKHLTPSSDATADGATSSNLAPSDDVDKSCGENAPNETGGNKQPQPDDAAADNNVADAADVADFLVVRRGRKCRPAAAAERPSAQLQTELSLERRQRHKVTFCDSLDEFAMYDDRAMARRTDQESRNRTAASSVNESATFASTQSPPPPPSTKATHLTETSNQCANPHNRALKPESIRPVSMRYNDVVKRSRPPNGQEKSVVDASTERSMRYQHTEPCSDVDQIQTTATGNAGQDERVSTLDVQPVDLPDSESSSGHSEHIAIGQVAGTVSSSSQTANAAETPHYSKPPSSSKSAATDVVCSVDGGEPSRRSSPVVFLDAGRAKTNNCEVPQGGFGLSFGSIDDIASVSAENVPRNSDEVAARSGRECSDVATSPIQLSPVTSSPRSPIVASHCRRIIPLCRTTGSSSGTSGAPVGIVPPIMHVETASGDVGVSADDENSTPQYVSYQFNVLA